MLDEHNRAAPAFPKTVHFLKSFSYVSRKTPVQSLMNLAEVNGPIFRLRIVDDLIIVSSQEIANEVCDDTRFEKKVFHALSELRTFAGDGLFTALNDETNWALAHRILLPAFGPGSLRIMYHAMLDITTQLLESWQRLPADASLDVADQMTRLTLDTIALSAFDYRFHSFRNQEVHPFIVAMSDGLAEAGARGRRPMIFTKMMRGTAKRFVKDARTIHDIADHVIRERLKNGSAPKAKPDLLSIMLESMDPKSGEKLDPINIRYQLVTFLIAGHETTSGLLSFAIYELLQNPEIMVKARAEVDEVLQGEVPTVERLQKLKYIDQIFKESLRLWPTAPAFGRKAIREDVLGGKYRITPNQTILVLLPTLHRDPKIWANPEMFDPDRMRSDRFAKIPPNAYKPWGTGARACIGRAFAIQEATLVLAMILQKFELEAADPAYQLKIKETLTLKPDGFRVKVKSRG